MRKSALLLLLLIPFVAFSVQKGHEFKFRLTGKVVQFDAILVQVQQKSGTKVWIPKTTIREDIRVGATVVAHVTMKDLGKNMQALKAANARRVPSGS